MDMKKSLCAIMAALLLLSCQEEELCTSPTPIEKPIAEHTFTIPVDSALANLAAFMADEETSTTRSAAVRVVSSVIPIKYSSKMTRSTGANVDCENLLYVANFENEKGYAILAADTRIGDEILAVVDEGSLSEATVCAVMDMVDEEERIIYEDYPLTGPGFFTLPETGDELYMNPNTVNLYIEAENDTLVGNFCLNDEDYENDSIIDFKPNPENTSSTPELLTTSLCVSYAMNEIMSNDQPLPMKPKPDDDSEEVGDNGGTSGIGSGGSGSGDVTITTETIVSNWVVKEKVSPMLTTYVKWKQGSPFNKYCPVKKHPFKKWKEPKATAGCFPIAISKVMTHLETPNVYDNDGYTIDWKELKKSVNSYKSYLGEMSAANLIKKICDECDCLYFYGATFAFPFKVVSYLNSIGFNNVKKTKYNFDRVKTMLDSGSPLIICSIPGVSIKNSHSWNIDGYEVRERIITTKTYRNGILNNTTQKTETKKMVHCDLGWGGPCNGYYISGVFDLNGDDVEFDWYNDSGSDYYFNNYLRIITYDRP